MHISQKNIDTNTMIAATIILSIILLLMIPLHFIVNVYIDFDNISAVIIIQLYSVVFFDCIVSIEPRGIKYSGSINGFVPFSELELGGNSGIMKAFEVKGCNVEVQKSFETVADVYGMCIANIASSIATDIINNSFATYTRCVMCDSNNCNASIKLSTTAISLVTALAR